VGILIEIGRSSRSSYERIRSIATPRWKRPIVVSGRALGRSRARCPSIRQSARCSLFDPVVGEALLLGFFELRGDALDPKVVSVGQRRCA
jgi:hypothetical protein